MSSGHTLALKLSDWLTATFKAVPRIEYIAYYYYLWFAVDGHEYLVSVAPGTRLSVTKETILHSVQQRIKARL